MGLPHPLYIRCCETLLECSEFDSDDSLRAVFVRVELSPYRDRLPQVGDKNKRVSRIIDLLQDKHLSDGQPVFPILIETLRDRYDSLDSQHRKLADLHTTLNSLRFVDISFVVMAMTHGEATALDEGNVFNGSQVAVTSDEYTQFQQFRDVLREHGILDLLSHYGEFRDSYKPYPCPQTAIRDIIVNMVEHINRYRHETAGLPLIRPQFLSEDFFGEARSKRLRMWEQLRLSGFVLVVDSVSLFHPMLRQMLVKSETSSSERVAMLVLSPVSSRNLPVNQLIEQMVDSQMELVYSRFDERLDKRCEIGCGDLRAIQRWLCATLPEVVTIVQDQRPNPASIRVMRERMGESSGTARLVFGQGGGS